MTGHVSDVAVVICIGTAVGTIVATAGERSVRLEPIEFTGLDQRCRSRHQCRLAARLLHCDLPRGAERTAERNQTVAPVCREDDGKIPAIRDAIRRKMFGNRLAPQLIKLQSCMPGLSKRMSLYHFAQSVVDPFRSLRPRGNTGADRKSDVPITSSEALGSGSEPDQSSRDEDTFTVDIEGADPGHDIIGPEPGKREFRVNCLLAPVKGQDLRIQRLDP